MVIRCGSFKFLVVSFDLTNIMTTLCNLMNDVLCDFLDGFIVVYLDDTVVYGETFTKHVHVTLSNTF